METPLTGLAKDIQDLATRIMEPIPRQFSGAMQTVRYWMEHRLGREPGWAPLGGFSVTPQNRSLLLP